MFIERKELSDNDFTTMLKGAGYNGKTNIVNYSSLNKGYIYVNFITDSMGPQPEFKCTDFEMFGVNYTEGINFNKSYRKMMKEKYGHEYVMALADHFDKLKDEAMEAVIED